MDAPKLHSRSVRFSDPRQERIYKRLLLLGRGPAGFYRDACRLMAENEPLETKTHLVAHCLREIESALRQVLLPYKLGPLKDSKDSHKKQIEIILRAYDFGEDVKELWLKCVGKTEDGGLYRFTHRRGLAAPRPGDESFRKIWDDTETVLDVVLAKFETRFLDSLKILDELLTRESPTLSDVNLIQNKVPNNSVTLGYFFNRLGNPAWLEPLKSEGFFSHPPDPVLDNEGGIARFQPWAESRYLAKMAALRDYQKKVVQIALDIPETENIYLHEDLVDIALALPPHLATHIVPKLEKWLQASRHPFLPEKLGSLVSYLAKGGQIEGGLSLSRSLLAVIGRPSPKKDTTQSGEAETFADLRPEPEARFDLWQYDQIIKKNVTDLVTAAGLDAFILLCDLLETAVTLSRSETSEGPEDYSYIWRPNIGDLEKRHRVKDILVSAVRDAAEQIGRADPAKIHELVRELDRRPWRIFHRLALHIVRMFADQVPDLVTAFLTDQQKFTELGQRHEYRRLAEGQFGRLLPQDQEKILRWIQKIPDVERFREWRKEQTGNLPNDEEINKYVIRAQLQYLKPLRGVLPLEWKQRYQEWVAKVGEPEDFDAYPRSWVGPTSPKSEQELGSMAVADIINYLNTWQPSDDPMSPSPEGLGRILAAVIATDPGRFASEAQRFQEVDPTYVRSLLRGLHDAATGKRTFLWQPVLAPCQWVMQQPREIPGRKSEYGDLDPGWGWTRKTIAELLSAGLEQGVTEICYEFRPIVWEILKLLTQDPEPTPEYEATYGGSNMDPSHISINTTRGEAMHAVVSYALWVRRHLEKLPDGKERLLRGFEEMPEVRSVLDEHLDVLRDPSLAIRSVYGRWLPRLTFLDKDWSKSRLQKIFPEDESLRGFWDAAWESWIVFNYPNNPMFDLLRDQYAAAIERLGTPRNERRVLEDPDERLAEHMMVFYWEKKLDLSYSLFERFWEKASDEVRAHAIEFVGRSVKHAQREIEADILGRLQELWASRLLSAQSKPRSNGYQAELAAFGWWFVSEKFDDYWAIEQLLLVLRFAGRVDPVHWVIERLATLASKIPLQVLDCLRMIIEGDSQHWITLGSTQEIRSIISVALASGNLEVAKRARELVNVLAARGRLEFMDLLQGGRVIQD